MYVGPGGKRDKPTDFVQPTAQGKVTQDIADDQQQNYSPGFEAERLRPVLENAGGEGRSGRARSQNWGWDLVRQLKLRGVSLIMSHEQPLSQIALPLL